MQVTTAVVKELRQKTGAGIMECKKALLEAEGNSEKAAEILKQHGLALTQKKSDRTVGQGIVEAYVHPGGQVGAIIEVNCETDFVARTEEFKELAHDLVLQVTAMSPQFVTPDDIPPQTNVDQQTVCLLLQPFIKDSSKTIEDIITEAIAKVGENIKVRRFVRFELGL